MMNTKKISITRQFNKPTRKSSHSKPKGKIGEQIRKKIKVNNDSQRIKCQQIGKENIIQNSERSWKQKNKLNRKEQDCKSQKFQSIIGKNIQESKKQAVNVLKESKSSRSLKSVRFSDTFEESKKIRKSSILKNSSIMKTSFISDKGSLKNSICSNILKGEQTNENSNSNRVIHEKFDKILKSHIKTNKKYSDEMFPPIWSSLSHIISPEVKKIRWKRISDLYPGKYLTVWNTNSQVTINVGKFSKNNLFANCLNAIKQNNSLLEKMFENQKYNSNGVYFVKINQNSTWRYVIVDDFIPVSNDPKNDESAYLRINSSSQQLEIWPLLLQKAYAKYYSTYQSLSKGNAADLLEELTACPLSTIDVKPQNMQYIKGYLQNLDSIMFATHNNGRMYPIVSRRQKITMQNPFNKYVEQTMSDKEFLQSFDSLSYIFRHKFFYSGCCTIKFNSRSEHHTSIRTVKIQEQTKCVISIIQKDEKHYGNQYQYTWMRMLVLMKESEKNYRWVAAQYSNHKNIQLELDLEPAEYYIVLIPQWQTRKGFDFNLAYYGDTSCQFQRKPYEGNQFVITEGAMDLAQRYGRLKQLNQNICTYSYIDRKVGLIIENINNERANGIVRILRSIQGLRKGENKVIQALNKQFEKQEKIQVKIGSLDHFTVVLGIVGEINQSFLDQFDFGN